MTLALFWLHINMGEIMVNAVEAGSRWAPQVNQDSYRPPSNEVFSLPPSPRLRRGDEFTFFGADGFTASDAVDIVNPLQHLPIIGPLYREFTGDNLDPFSRIAGNTLFFGPFGAAFSSINVAVEKITGKDLGSNVIAILNDENTDTAESQTTATSPISPKAPVPYKNNPIDPVLVWATAEINHQNSVALKQGINSPTRVHSTLVASTAPTTIHSTQITATSPISPKAPVTYKNNPINPVLVWATAEINHQNSVALKQGIDLPTHVYSTLVASTTPTTIHSTQINVAPTRSQPAKLTPEIAQQNLSQTNPLGSISTNAGLFSSSMNNALSKYHQAKNFRLLLDKASTPLTSSLH